MKNIGVLISGGGSNLQAIIDACESGILKGLARVAVVVSNRADAYGLERAEKHKIPAFFFNPRDFNANSAYCSMISGELRKHKVDIVCLAGYMSLIDPCLLNDFKNKIINIHPALLPKYGGKGMYGHHVHKAVIAAGESESGVTVHWVNEVYDSGEIILQRKVPVLINDTPEELAARVLAVEHIAYPEAILKILKQG